MAVEARPRRKGLQAMAQATVGLLSAICLFLSSVLIVFRCLGGSSLGQEKRIYM